MPSDLQSLVISAAASITVVLVSLYFARRAGLTDVQRELRATTGEVIVALKERVAALESENKALREEMSRALAKKDAQIAHLEFEVRRLEVVVDRLTARNEAQ